MNKIYFLGCLVLAVFMFSCQSESGVNSVSLSPEIFKDSLNKANAQIIDVRTLSEFREGHIEHALNIDYFSENFADSIALLKVTKPVFIYCRSGKRSSKSASAFLELGFKKIYELEGGILNWRNENLKIVSN